MNAEEPTTSKTKGMRCARASKVLPIIVKATPFRK